MPRSKPFFWLALALALSLATLALASGCSSTEVIGTPPSGGVIQDSGQEAALPEMFRLTANPTYVQLAPGAQQATTIAVQRAKDFSGPITITVSNLPPGVTASTVTVAAEASSGLLTFTAAAGIHGAESTLAVVEGASGPHRAKVDVEVTTEGPVPGLDQGFGTAGIAKVGGGLSLDDVHGIAVQADGKLVAAGIYGTGFTTHPALIRYLPGGGNDPSFGTDGVVVLAGDVRLIDVAIQADGKILVLEARDFRVTRLLADGKIDSTYGTNGVVDASFATETLASAFRLQPDGKLVVVGVTAGPNGDDFAVARYAPEGTLDTTFGTGGRVTTSVVAGDDGATALAFETNAQTTVSIVVAGTATVADKPQIVLARYKGDNGALDTTFDTDGVVTYSSGGGASGDDAGVDGGDAGTAGGPGDRTAAVEIVGTAIVVAGQRVTSDTTADLEVLRFTTTGALDNGWNGTGVQIVSLPGAMFPAGMAIVGGKVVVGGDRVPAGTREGFAFLSRFDDTGALDSTFGTGGTLTGTLPNTFVRAIIAQPDGALVLAGGILDQRNVDIVVLRYVGGALDPSFGQAGVQRSVFGPGDVELRAVALQSDGKIVVAGQANVGLDFGFYVARLLPNGTLDTTFGDTGKGYISINPSSGNDIAYDVKVLPDGKILAGGEGGPGVLVVRLTPDGKPDTTFGRSGITGVVGGTGYTMALQGDKILVGGGTDDGNFFLLRLDARGELDKSGKRGVGFGTEGYAFADFGLLASATTMTTDKDGKIVLGGVISHEGPPNFYDMGIVKFESDGTVDPSFGGDGLVLADSAPVEFLLTTAVQPDGKILLGGRMTAPAKGGQAFGLFRLTADGRPDEAFGIKGRAPTFFDVESQADALFVEDKSRMILASGRSGDFKLGLVRFSPSGVPVWTGNADGMLTLDLPDSEGFALTQQADGQVLVAGYARDGFEDTGVVVRVAK